MLPEHGAKILDLSASLDQPLKELTVGFPLVGGGRADRYIHQADRNVVAVDQQIAEHRPNRSSIALVSGRLRIVRSSPCFWVDIFWGGIIGDHASFRVLNLHPLIIAVGRIALARDEENLADTERFGGRLAGELSIEHHTKLDGVPTTRRHSDRGSRFHTLRSVNGRGQRERLFPRDLIEGLVERLSNPELDVVFAIVFQHQYAIDFGKTFRRPSGMMRMAQLWDIKASLEDLVS